MEGLTGNIKFDTLGFRSDFVLEVVELKKEGLVKVGAWNQGQGINFTRNYTETYNEVVESLHNKTLKITTILVSTTILKLRFSSWLRVKNLLRLNSQNTS